ncbi:MAG: hypothetical protein JST16_01510 [Bdellovibrionales bacterium]|nr:hypothetical protein [Bdellovibrionales bacterium]
MQQGTLKPGPYGKLYFVGPNSRTSVDFQGGHAVMNIGGRAEIAGNLRLENGTLHFELPKVEERPISPVKITPVEWPLAPLANPSTRQVGEVFGEAGLELRTTDRLSSGAAMDVDGNVSIARAQEARLVQRMLDVINASPEAKAKAHIESVRAALDSMASPKLAAPELPPASPAPAAEPARIPSRSLREASAKGGWGMPIKVSTAPDAGAQVNDQGVLVIAEKIEKRWEADGTAQAVANEVKKNSSTNVARGEEKASAAGD